MWFACQGSNENGIEVVRLLVDAGADINRVGEHGYTPLHMAAQWGHMEVVEYLVEMGADPHAESDADGRPMDMARAKDRTDVLAYLDVFEFAEHTANVQDAVFSYDGKYVVSGGLEGKCRVWNVEDGQQTAIFEGHLEEEAQKRKRSRVASVAVSPDGHVAVSGSYGETIRIWDPRSARQIAEIPRQEYSGVNHLSFTPDGRTLIAVHTDGLITFVDDASWREEDVIRAHRDRTLAHSMTSDGKTLVTGSRERTIKVCDVASRSILESIRLITD